MVCLNCGAKTHVSNSRAQKRSNRIWRRRVCVACQALFTTEESVRLEAAWAVRDNQGGLQPFCRDQLFLSLYKSCQHRPQALADASALTDTIIDKLVPLVKGGSLWPSTIIQVAQVTLNRFDKAASVHYQAYHH